MDLLRLARAGDVKSLVELASHRVDIDGNLALEEWNALQVSCSQGDGVATRALLAGAADVDHQIESRVVPRHSPLMIASRYGYVHIMEALLAAGANVHLTDNYGYSALHYAVANGHVKAVDMLLKAGAQAGQLTKDGISALDFAVEQNFTRIADALRKWQGKYQNEDLLSFKAWLDAIDCGQFFDRFVQAGYDLAFTAKHGLSDDDLDCVGVPMSLLGLRKKLKALHRLDEFKDQGGEEEEEEDEETEEEDEERGDDEEDEDEDSGEEEA